jgi:hypothetical protein
MDAGASAMRPIGQDAEERWSLLTKIKEVQARLVEAAKRVRT